MRNMVASTLTFVVLLLQWSSLSYAFSHHNHIHNQFIKRQTSLDGYTGVVPGYNISMPVDHFNESDTRTYNNRYWVNDTYYQQGGPIFFYDNGEVGVSDKQVAHILAEINSTSAVMKLAQRYHGMVVLWEHRYYGLSYPIPLNVSTGEPEGGYGGYKYLTFDQALEDVVYFANNWQLAGCSGDECSMIRPSKTPWVWLGGSYPGIRGALIRVRNPEIFYAVWASSAPVEARYDGFPYFYQTFRTLPSNCSEDILAAVKLADDTMDGKYGSEAYANLQRLDLVASITETSLNRSYNLSQYNLISTRGIAQFMLNGLQGGFQNTGPGNSTDRFCSYLGSYDPNATPLNTSDPYISILTNPGTRPVSSASLTSTYNSTIALEAYFYATRLWFAEYLAETRNLSNWYPISPTFEPDMNAWSYQALTQFGWIQGSDVNNISYISKYYNISAARDARTLFYYDIEIDDFPEYPDTDAVNKYGGWNMTPSNVMFTDGQYDPWKEGTLMSNDTSIGAPIRHMTQTIPACNQPPPGSDVFGVIYPNEAHVPDLEQFPWLPYDESSAVYQGVQLFSKALDVWLPCFNSSSGSK